MASEAGERKPGFEQCWDNDFISEVVRSPERPFGKGWYEERPGIWRREFTQERKELP